MKKYTYTEAVCPASLISPKLAGIHPVCLDILYGRGFDTTTAMEDFLFPSLTRSLQSHPALLDTDKAIKILAGAVKNKTPVTIYHDYDADGITAAAVAMELLGVLQVPTHLYCNDRAIDGFGICAAGVRNLLERYPDTGILLTVDNGIAGLEGVQYAKERGLTVIVTDHHEPVETLPIADAVVDHKRKDEPDNQDKNCCGAGVVWKVLLALFVELGYDVTPVMQALDIVALGTVADIVPLLGDNRAIVREGLKIINSGARPFFRKACEVLELSAIDAQTISFKLAPMFNALSRMGRDPIPAVATLLCTDMEKLHGDVVEMDEINQMRRAETDREMQLVAELLPPISSDSVILFHHESLKEGIVGIVAGQLSQEHQLPCGVFAPGADGNWKGSLRAPDGFPLIDALNACSEYLVAYGGHYKAAGATVRGSDFEAFQKKMEAWSTAYIKEHGLVSEVPIDVVVDADAISVDLVRQMSMLAPCGEGFPPPRFGLRANIEAVQYMGSEKQHVKYQDASGLSVIRWNGGEAARAAKRVPAKFVGTPSLNSYMGNVSVQFIVE